MLPFHARCLCSRLGVARAHSALNVTQARPAAHVPRALHRVQAAHTQSESPKAALLVIGDEILAGSIADSNTPWLARLLYSRGVDLTRVEYIPDDKADIKDTVLDLRKRVGPNGFVFTSGGIGPTHDDVTYEAIAVAFGVPLELHAPTVERMRAFYAKRGMELNDARLRMATLPSSSEVLFTEGIWVPLVNLQGVYILPGIPRLFQSMISSHQSRFTGMAYQEVSLYSTQGESFISAEIAKVASEHPKVSIGSYPNTNEQTEGAWKVRLNVKGRSKDSLEAAVSALQQQVPNLQTQEPAQPR